MHRSIVLPAVLLCLILWVAIETCLQLNAALQPKSSPPLRVFPPSKMMPQSDYRKKVRIILQGGGVKATFQIGFLKALVNSNKYHIDRVYGTSVGAIIAPLVAAGRVDELQAAFEKMHSVYDIFQKRGGWYRLWPELAQAVVKLGAYDKIKLIDEFLDLIPLDEKQSAFNKCHVVAWDYFNKKEVWFTGEDLPTGIRGSSAVWLAVPPYPYKDTYLIDGGVTEFVPISVIDPNDGFDGVYIAILCNDLAHQPVSKLPSNGLELLDALKNDAITDLAIKELTAFKTIMGDRLVIVKPPSDVFSGYLDIDTKKMKRSFEIGLEEFRKSNLAA